MAIATLDQYVAATKQRCPLQKTVARTTVAASWFSLFDVAGNPGAGTLAGTSTAAGVVPTDAIAGYPPINAFGGAATGYVSRVEFGNTVACRIQVFDRLFVAGGYAFNAATTLAAQPSFAARVPSTIYTGLEIWVEQVTLATGNQAVNVTYTNESGTGSRTTGAVGVGAAPTVGRCWQLPLQAGDAGIQRVDVVTGTVATVGTFNVMVLRPIWTGRVRMANDGDVHDMLRTGLPQIYADSALYMMISSDGTSSGAPELEIEVASG